MGKTREGDGGSPYTKPPKPNPGPFVPAPSRLAKAKKKKKQFLNDPTTSVNA